MTKKLLSFNSEIDEHPKDVSIKLKKHQLAMLKRCKEIENNNNIFGIMNDKPGTGKTYAILGLIFNEKKKFKYNCCSPKYYYTMV